MASIPADNHRSNGNDRLSPLIMLGNPRDDDPTTLSLRQGVPIRLEDIASNLSHYDASSTIGSSSAAPTHSVYSSRKESNTTKPTSYGTSYPVDGSKGKGVATYASSLSATHGSGSDTEREIARDTALLGMGDWAGVNPTRAPKKTNRKPRIKKPVVIIQRERDPSDDDSAPATGQINRNNGRSVKYLRHRRSNIQHDQLDLAEEGLISETSTLSPRTALSKTRFYIMMFLIIATILTFALGTWGAHHTGKSSMPRTKGIIFVSTLLISLFSVFAMIIARRTLQEALLTGLLEFIVGFALLVEIHEFI